MGGRWVTGLVASIEDDWFIGASLMGGQILVDGVQHSRIIAVNQPRGYIERYKTNEAGEVLLEADGQSPATEYIHGEVRVRMSKELLNLYNTTTQPKT